MSDEHGRTARRQAGRGALRGALTLLGAGAAASAGALAYGRFVELNRFHVRRETLAVLPPGAREIRVLHLSDLHMIPGQRRKVDFVRGLAELEPDLVLDTGDNFSHLEALPWLLEALDPLLDLPGAYVPGSNCYFAPQPKNPARYLWLHRMPGAGGGRRREDPAGLLPFREMHEAFDARGWLGLVNATGELVVNGVRIDFSGVDDPHLGYDRHPGFAPRPGEGRAGGSRAGTPSVRIGVAHAPYLRTLERFARDGADAVFAGHTHGGQICLPGGRALVSNCDLPPSRAKGVSRDEGIPVQVSAGLGTSRFAPVRLFCPPEAVLVTLTARPSDESPEAGASASG
jgi:predicted MPP superfamily phosphohydrolase